MRTNFNWLLGSVAVTCAAVGSVVATLWLLGLSPNGTESRVFQAGPDSRPAVFRAEALPRPRLPRPHRAVPRHEPAVAQRPRAARAQVRAQLPHLRTPIAPLHLAASKQAPHAAISPSVAVNEPVPALGPARTAAPALPTPVAPPAPAVPTPPATPAPQPTTPEPIPAAPVAPVAPESQLAAVATVQTGVKKTTGKVDKSAVPSRRPGSQASPTAGPVRPTLQDGDHGDSGSSEPSKPDSSEQRAKGDRHDKHKGDATDGR
ncbi:MAG TPA: hypothetical protein VLK53_14570 [Gaiellaceae bacterium]|nr:hypothetical protein [Gaiellaceae bacterium]